MRALELGAGLALAARAPRTRRRFDLAAGLPSGAALTRASEGARWTSDRRLGWCAADVARIDHDVASGASKGLLLEAAGMNQLPQSGAMSLWSADDGGGGAGITVAPAAASAPDGGPADRLSFVRAATFARVSQTAWAIPAGAPGVFSIWLRAAVPGPGIALRVDGADSGTLALTAEWRRYSMAFTGSGSVLACQLLLWATIAGSPAAAVVDAWGAQVEAGTTPSSLIRTGQEPVARAADRLRLDLAARGVGDGAATLRCRFDDGSSQDVTVTVSGGHADVPVPLARPWVRSITAL